MKVFDEVLGREVEIQEVITPEIEKEIKIDDPDEITKVIEGSEQ